MKFAIFLQKTSKMKTLKSIILCLIVLMSYNIYSQEVSTTELDETIDKYIPKAKKNKLNNKQLTLLKDSYHEANSIDHNTIMKLKESGQPDIWIEIYNRLASINARQNKINILPDNIKDAMNFKLLSLDNEIANAKEKAELYICAKAKILLKNINDENLKETNKLINQLCKINPKSKNIEELVLKSIILSSEQIIFRVATPIEMHFPQEYAKLILNFEGNTIYDIPFDVIHDNDKKYDLMIRIMIDEKNISPERIESVTFEEKTEEFTAIITDKTMIKSATLKGKIQFIDVKNDEILTNTPYEVTSTFHYQYADVNGNKSACSEYTLLLSEKEVIDFPSDESLLKDVSIKLNQTIKSHFFEK